MDDRLLHEVVLNYVQDLRYHGNPVSFNKLAADVYALVAARTQLPVKELKDEIGRRWSGLRCFVRRFYGGDLRLAPSGSDLEVSLRTTGANRLREELRDLGVTPQMPRGGGHPPRASPQQQRQPPPQTSLGPAACDERGDEEGRACCTASCAAGHDAGAGAAAFAPQAVDLAGAPGTASCAAGHDAGAGAAAFASQAVALAGASGGCGATHREPSPSAIDKAIPSVSLQARNSMQVRSPCRGPNTRDTDSMHTTLCTRCDPHVCTWKG